MEQLIKKLYDNVKIHHIDIEEIKNITLQVYLIDNYIINIQNINNNDNNKIIVTLSGLLFIYNQEKYNIDFYIHKNTILFKYKYHITRFIYLDIIIYKCDNILFIIFSRSFDTIIDYTFIKYNDFMKKLIAYIKHNNIISIHLKCNSFDFNDGLYTIKKIVDKLSKYVSFIFIITDFIHWPDFFTIANFIIKNILQESNNFIYYNTTPYYGKINSKEYLCLHNGCSYIINNNYYISKNKQNNILYNFIVFIIIM
jgi:hypothetical protein